ncbi:tRNA (adenosine(37)-N6)-threonylcarbamoyltransferase complex dimerization subunit type 1 TsaB [Intrasporangium sp. YIM S08009]|uniref:tRNA (adenosine(37)-N6)-threonylcarbamoyltransferase complex dimerization subunit type 1 TsaB n=1 Tax=Intrasporangium zincisolvens TaxID=3080018 RepID=UPI002B05DD8E|nr:tRNA (adenosine(37)-N6)-threonylcarbamoyltransferase complex dimerization subunit type 1 TsaB [Intrasporangium sp. YIM S08009]
MLLLAIDTSTTAITVALHDGSSVLARATTLDARAHAEYLAPGIRSALAEAGAEPADVTDVVVGIGPGPFTGLRVGIVTGRTFAFALGLPVRGLTSLDALAHEAWLGGRRGDLLVATDARRKEVYAARYALDDAGATRVLDPVVARAADLDADLRSLPTVGRGPQLYPDALPHGVGPLDVDAGALADLAAARLTSVDGHGPAPDGAHGSALQLLDPGHGFDGLEPLYLRRPDAAPAAPSTKSTLG